MNGQLDRLEDEITEWNSWRCGIFAFDIADGRFPFASQDGWDGKVSNEIELYRKAALSTVRRPPPFEPPQKFSIPDRGPQ